MGEVGTGRIYRVALLGNAMHQNNHARVFAPHPRIKMVAVVDEPGQERYVAERGRSLAARYGLPYVESLERAAEPDVDVVSLGVEIERRGRLAVRAAGWRKHLWLDKPPVATVEEAGALVDAVRAAGAAWCTAARDAIAAGSIGELTALHLDLHFAKGFAAGLKRRLVPAGTGARKRWTLRGPAGAADPDPTESSPNVVAKRELFELGWYLLALTWFLTGQRVQRVFAATGAFFLQPHRDFGVEDFATLVLTLEGGPPVTISTGRTGRQSHPGPARMALRATGTRGSFAVDGGRPAVAVYGDTLATTWGGVGSGILGATDAFGPAAMVDHFVAVSDGAEPSVLDAETGCYLTTALLAAYESAASGRPIDVPSRTP